MKDKIKVLKTELNTALESLKDGDTTKAIEAHERIAKTFKELESEAKEVIAKNEKLKEKEDDKSELEKVLKRVEKLEEKLEQTDTSLKETSEKVDEIETEAKETKETVSKIAKESKKSTQIHKTDDGEEDIWKD